MTLYFRGTFSTQMISILYVSVALKPFPLILYSLKQVDIQALFRQDKICTCIQYWNRYLKAFNSYVGTFENENIEIEISEDNEDILQAE